MSALTSLLVRDRVVPVSKIEEALQQQVLAGGDIETVLLEMNLVAEDVLSAYRAVVHDRPPATREEIMGASRHALGALPREVARSAGAIPLQLEGRTMVVAVCEPLSAAAREQVVDALGCEVSERIVNGPRFAAALAHHYGVQLDPRMRRLTDALQGRDAGVMPSVRPPGPSLRPSAPAEQGEPGQGADVLAQRAEPRGHPVITAAVRTVGVPVGSASAMRPGLSSMPPSRVSTPIVRAARGPMDEARARELLAQAMQRDDVLFVLLRFTQQFFDFVGIFSVGKEGARGRMAHGAGLSPELLEHVVIPTQGSGLVARAVRDKRVIVGDLSASDEERVAAALLGRPAGRPGVVVPIVLGPRAVLLLYADRAGEGISQDDAADILALVPAVTGALKRLILEQKTLRRSSRPPVRVPTPLPDPPSVVNEVGDGAPAEVRPDLQAVDIERLMGVLEHRRERPPEPSASRKPAVSPHAREMARRRVQGVPRTAPPPPLHDSLAPAAAAGLADGSYHHAASAGALLEENTRPVRARPEPPAVLGAQQATSRSAALGSSFAQVKPVRIEVERQRLQAPTHEAPHAAQESSRATARTVRERRTLTALPAVLALPESRDQGDSAAELVEGVVEGKNPLR